MARRTVPVARLVSAVSCVSDGSREEISLLASGEPGHAGRPRRPGNRMLTSEIQARDGAGLTGATGVARGGYDDGVTSTGPRFKTATPADIPAVSGAPASA